jgi:hypothetical protein
MRRSCDGNVVFPRDSTPEILGFRRKRR